MMGTVRTSIWRSILILTGVVSYLLGWVCLGGLADAQVSPPLVVSEEVVQVPMSVRGFFKEERLLLEATLWRPTGDGPFPLVLISHGVPRNPAPRRNLERARYVAQSEWFASQGMVVLIPMRRGYANSDGEWAEGGGRCDSSDWFHAGLEGAKDIRASVEFMRTHPFVDRGKILLIGQSGGGVASLALASQGLEGLSGVISFAGGRGSAAPGKHCSPEGLVATMRSYGKNTKVPALWIYAENDTWFPPDFVREMHAAFVKGGGQAELVMVPPFGQQGHVLFSRGDGIRVWAPPVKRFLDRLGFVGAR